MLTIYWQQLQRNNRPVQHELAMPTPQPAPRSLVSTLADYFALELVKIYG
jgi:hypothetical protein